MEEVVYHLNLDYENFLSGSTKKIKGSSWFDHIFFFVNQSENSILKTSYNFPKEYLSYIKKFNVASNRITQKGKSNPWWGSCLDLDRERFFNSKIEMTNLGNNEGWIPVPSVTSRSEVLARLSFPIISRAEWGFSGRGVSIAREEDELKKVTTPSVYSNFVEKIKDYGVTFNINENSFFIIENFIDQYGQFKGGTLRSIDESMGDEEFKKLMEIRNKLISLGAVNSIQIDTFTYKGGYHPFVEVNYRKTMGLMINTLGHYFTEKYISWGILKVDTKKTFSEMIECLSKYKEKVVLLSPVDKFISVALLSEVEIEEREVLKDLEKFIRNF